MMTFVYLLASLFISGCLGLFMLVLVAGSLMEQEKHYKALEKEMDKHFNAIMEKMDKDYEKIIKELQ